ncbi:histone H1 [Penaeus vannamei]|uniref:Histone H1 n=1 Tax=Penaeus vannamei TaxID=6689 RepID=A0A423U9W4_PENVA|nr:histone H1-like [Penaeus vannamei]ROT85488.1 histone H1 [Penaeus vannamei]
MAPIPKAPRTPRTPRTPIKSLRTPKSTLKTPRSLKAPRTLKTPRRLKATAGRSSRTPRANAKPLTIGDMVFEAVEALNDRRGASLHAIKRYLRDNKKVDTEAKAVFIKKYLKAFVEEGKLVQVAGTGANGTFKLPGKKATSEKLSGGSKAVVKVASRPKIGKIAGKASVHSSKISDKNTKMPRKIFKGKISMKH